VIPVPKRHSSNPSLGGCRPVASEAIARGDIRYPDEYRTDVNRAVRCPISRPFPLRWRGKLSAGGARAVQRIHDPDSESVLANVFRHLGSCTKEMTMERTTKRSGQASLTAFFVASVLLVIAGSPLYIDDQDQVAAQSGSFFRVQCPNLWDAVGRRFFVPMADGAPSASIDMEVAEFSADNVPPASLNCISDKLRGFHSLYGPVGFDPPGVFLPHFEALSVGQAAQISYGLFISNDTSGQTYISMLFGRDNHAVALTFTSPTIWTNQYLDATAYGIWTALGSFPRNVPTASDQTIHSGLWGLPVLPSSLVASESADYLSTLFAGVDDNYQPMTPALAEGISHASPELFTPSGVPSSNGQTSVPTIVPTSFPIMQPTCVPNHPSPNCSLTPLGVLQGRQTQTAEAHETEQSRP